MQNQPNYIIPKPKQTKEQTNEEIYSKSYNKEGVLGCKHYERNCKIRAFCCQRFYGCRLCHNEDIDTHEINRHATKEVLCMFCNTIQPVSNQCVNKECNQQFAHYFCSICVFYDNNKSKQLFHCDGCGICRVGLRENYTHCDQCKQCLPPSVFKTHRCIKDQGLSNCPICMEDLFNSRESVMILENCGHTLHSQCYTSLISSRSFQCPLCKKSLGKLDWSRHDRLVGRSKMPEMYAGSTVSILCNDCNEKSTDIPLHFLGHKCPKCESYNTTETSKNLVIDKTKSADFRVVEEEDDDDDGDGINIEDDDSDYDEDENTSSDEEEEEISNENGDNNNNNNNNDNNSDTSANNNQ